MYLPLDGPSSQGVLSVTAATVAEARVGGSAFAERKVITLQANKNFYVYFANAGETPSAANVQARGFIQYKDAKESYEASNTQVVFLLSSSGTALIRIAERS